MEYSFHFVYPGVMIGAMIITIAAFLMRLFVVKPTIYRYSLASYLNLQGQATNHPYKKIILITRFFVLLLLSFLLSKPQLVDYHIPTIVEGIDIMLVLDISGSMRFRDSDADQRTRIDIAKEEALRFVSKREHDAIGLVFFAADAISRCPLTLDKRMVKQIIEETGIDTLLNSDGTLLATGIVTAANRLKQSRAKSKIMILLTDGEPSPGDIDPEVALDIAKQLGIKIYTIGIGSETPIVIQPFFQVLPGVNKELLEKIAKETGGRYFLARNAQDMRAIYDTIDALEKTEHQLPIFNRYFDIFIPFVCLAFGLLLWELFASGILWFSI